MCHHVKKLMYTVRVDEPDPKFGSMWPAISRSPTMALAAHSLAIPPVSSGAIAAHSLKDATYA